MILFDLLREVKREGGAGWGAGEETGPYLFLSVPWSARNVCIYLFFLGYLLSGEQAPDHCLRFVCEESGRPTAGTTASCKRAIIPKAQQLKRVRLDREVKQHFMSGSCAVTRAAKQPHTQA